MRGGETGVIFMSAKSNSGRLFFLDLGAGRILSVNRRLRSENGPD
jgi:hypothetical protein